MNNNNHLIDNRQIRVFISSTFQDMQDERDYLMKRTFPKLRKLAAERDVTLTELDLRWGITEEESKSGKVVEICLREIENSIPFFIGIIGNRYGWVPAKEDIGGNVTERFADVNKYIYQHLSVTEMEMQFGVLSREEDMHAYFYIKEQEEDADNIDMLNRLKEEVRKSKYPSTTYSSIQDLGKQIERAFTDLLNKLYPQKKLTDHERRKIKHHIALRCLQNNHIRIADNIQLLNAFINSNKQTLVLTSKGWPGSGISATLTDWLKEEALESYSPIYYSVGADNIYDYTAVLEYIQKEMADLTFYTDNNKPFLVIIDGVERLKSGRDMQEITELIKFPARIIFTVTTLLDDAFFGWSYPVAELRELTSDERKELIISYLNEYHKHLSAHQLERICSNPLFRDLHCLKSMLNELIRFGDFTHLDERIDYYLLPQTHLGFYTAILLTYEKDFSDYGKSFTQDILSTLCQEIDNPKTESDIIELLQIIPFQWSDFFCSFSEYLTLEDGFIGFSNREMFDAIFDRYHMENSLEDKEPIYAQVEENTNVPNNATSLFENLEQVLEDWELEDFQNDESLQFAIQGESLLKRENPIAAIEVYKEQLKYINPIEPGSYGFMIYEGIIRSYRMLSQHEEAFSWSQLSVRNCWNEPKAHLYYAEQLEYFGQFSQAEEQRSIAKQLMAH